ncbi:response regulator transcription factor, partial [Acinetobacter baumannii]
MRILLAEDDRSQAESIQSWLELDGYQVDWVERGDYALTAIEQHDYDCILLDRGLPQLAGEKVLTTIRHKQKNVPVISLYTTNFTEPLSYQGSAFLKLPKFP